jgi:diacylglycerol kinase (ATP)
MHNTQQALKILFIVNPISGGKVKHDWEAAIRSFLQPTPHQPEFYLLQGKDDLRSIQYHIDLVRPDRVVAVGGDGTVKLLASVLKETTIPLGILPAGSANGMAKELGIPLDPGAAMEVITEGMALPIDMIRINEEEICIHLADIGLNAMLVHDFEKSETRGMWGYGRAVFHMLWKKQKMRVRITTDKGEVKRHAYMVALANARKYGTGANINPDGDVADGRFEVVVVRRLNLFEISKAIFTNKSFHPDKIEVFSTTQVDIQVQRPFYFQIDGEYMGKTARIHARILPGLIRMLVPAGGELAQNFKG